jgi:hypothetical protein
VESVAAGGLAGAAGDGCGAAEAGKGGGVAEAADVAGVRDHAGGDLCAGAVQVVERVAVLGEQRGDFGVELCDALVEVFDVTGEVADAAGRDLLDKSRTEADPLQAAQLALAGQVDNACLADRVDLIPVGAQALDRLGAVADEAPPLQLEQRQRAHELGLERASKLRAFAQDDLGDRDRVTGVGLTRPMTAPLPVRAPGRHVEHLVPGRLERGDKEPAIAGRAFNNDDRVRRVELDQPLAELAHPGRAVGKAERAELAAALVEQRSNVSVFVHIDSDDHPVLLSQG